MKILLEDILDNIDLEDSEDSSVVSNIINNSDDIDTDQFDYVIYIVNKNTNTFQKDAINEMFLNYINGKLKSKLDVYLDSYLLNIFEINKTDGKILNDQGILDFDLLDENPEFYGNVFCQIFLKFDGNLMHMLNIFDSTNCLIDAYTYFYRNHSVEEEFLWTNQRIQPKHFFGTQAYKKYNKEFLRIWGYNENTDIYKGLVQSIFYLFWEKNKVLKLDNFNTDKERKEYISKTLNKFIKNKQRL